MKGYKTAIFNGAVAALPLIDWVATNGTLITPILGAHASVILSVVGVANCLLRWATSTPIFNQK
jgi:hypothetical protein